MGMISVDKHTLEDLIDTKLRVITESIDEILKKWNYDSIDKFLTDARNGTLEEAEMDAISLKQLNADYQRLQNLLNSIEK